MVEFRCRRCKKTAIRPLETCMHEVDYDSLTDFRPPKDWKNGGFYYPIFCPECAEAHQKFMNMEDA